MSDQKNPYGSGTTGHVWDENLAEATNPPPKWWMIGLHASWILVLLYTIVYPSWPWFGGAFQGVLGWTSIGEYKRDLAAINEVRGKYESQLPGKSAAAILVDDELNEYVRRSAKVLFGENCAACHGSGGGGNPGYPVLADDEWLYGGEIDKIVQSISAGRQGMMPARGGAALTEAEVDELARAVAATDPTSSPLYSGKGTCFACHGPDGKGNPALGAPDLTDQIWRFGDGSVEDVRYTILHGVNDANDPGSRNAEMPSWQERLSETEIKKLAVYVHQFGGGK
ncbi:cytochrome-c oxidase, cbb3-type subunit III [Thiohalomonas denitrificans]|uniref:Cbb3-type cytochrome c oxidase subunit n=1 Tax=Thiohalomonas denitrificans TaxID=415747 RepID=A0A1G5QIA6_9GAMM|nr:cytochrome-c oxidase, cbb3-type subunit III [Thiohalomonas denitrificans]SCZ60909.1 cytochrome c oxidase cbb3-type subunit 3 [Thiohalomonas denitrificans]